MYFTPAIGLALMLIYPGNACRAADANARILQPRLQS
jgi:hypothetical protein